MFLTHKNLTKPEQTVSKSMTSRRVGAVFEGGVATCLVFVSGGLLAARMAFSFLLSQGNLLAQLNVFLLFRDNLSKQKDAPTAPRLMGRKTSKKCSSPLGGGTFLSGAKDTCEYIGVAMQQHICALILAERNWEL